MLNVAQKNAQSLGLKLNFSQHDWRYIPQHYHDKFDAVICLGNSFTHLESVDDRLLALKNFRATLKPGGLLLLDQRNYEKMLGSTDSKSATGNVYCGKSFEIKPSALDEKTATFEYSYENSSKFVLHMYTLFADNVKEWILEAGFKHHSMGPLLGEAPSTRSDNTSFILHRAIK
jgi:SAM-dependent methyltransferase